MHRPDCPHERALLELLIAAEPDVVRRGVEARARGPGWGVLVALPEELGAETQEEQVALEAARQVGHYVEVERLGKLIEMAAQHGSDLAAEIVRGLRRPPPEGEVHVLCFRGPSMARVTAKATPELAAARDLGPLPPMAPGEMERLQARLASDRRRRSQH